MYDGKKKYVDRKKSDISRTSSQVHRYSGKEKKRRERTNMTFSTNINMKSSITE